MKPTIWNRTKLSLHLFFKGHDCPLYITKDGIVKDIQCSECSYGDIDYEDIHSNIDKRYRALVDDAIRNNRNVDIPN